MYEDKNFHLTHGGGLCLLQLLEMEIDQVFSSMHLLLMASRRDTASNMHGLN